MSFIDNLKPEELFQIADGVPEETRNAIMKADGDQLRATLFYYLLDTQDGCLDTFQNHPDKPLTIQNSSEEGYYRKDGGMLANLSDQELRFLLLSPGMRKQFQYREDLKDFVFLQGDKFTPLQAQDAKEQTEPEITKDFQNRIKTQFMTQLENKRKAEFDVKSAKDSQEDSLEHERTELVNTIKACEANLNDHTHWYNSSSEYRDMQKKMEELRKFTEEMDMDPDVVISDSVQDTLHEYYQDAMKSIQKYLDGKNPDAFKNQYEETRYWTAKATLAKLKQLDKPIQQKEKEREEREKAAEAENDPEGQEIKELITPSPTEKNFQRHKKTAGDYADFEKYRNELAEKYRETTGNKNERGYHFLLRKALEAQDTLARMSLSGGFNEKSGMEEFKKCFKTLLMLAEVEQARQTGATMEDRGKKLERALMVPKSQRENVFNFLLNNDSLDLGQNFFDHEKIMQNDERRMKLLDKIAFRGEASELYSRIREIKKIDKANEQIAKPHVHKKKTLRDVNKNPEKVMGK